MRLPVALACLAAALSAPVLSGCFDPSYNCRILCDDRGGCPPGFHCVAGQNLCARDGIEMCELPMDGGMTDGDALPPRPDAAPAPAQICLQANQCVDLSQPVQDGLVLWLDPSNLSPILRSDLDVWRDRSGQGNDAYPANPSALPQITGNGVAFMNEPGGGLQIGHHPSLGFGATDFLVMVAATIPNGSLPTRFFMKGLPDRDNPRQVALAWGVSQALGARTLQGYVNDTVVEPSGALPGAGIRLFVLRRKQSGAELRVNGASINRAEIASPQLSTDNDGNVHLGGFGTGAYPVQSLHAAVVVRGAIDDADVASLEAFVMQFLAISP